MKLDKKTTEPLVKWFKDNIESIKKSPEEFSMGPPIGHKGFVLAMGPMETSEVQKKLLSKAFPLNSFLNIVSELKNKYNIPEDVEIAEMGWMIVYAEKGYLCKLHKDESDSEEFIHTRLNVLISKSQKGGQPIIIIPEDSEEIYNSQIIPHQQNYPNIIDVEENEPWICLASEYCHSTVKVEGDKPRIMISLGFKVPRYILEKNKYIAKKEKKIKKSRVIVLMEKYKHSIEYKNLEELGSIVSYPDIISPQLCDEIIKYNKENNLYKAIPEGFKNEDGDINDIKGFEEYSKRCEETILDWNDENDSKIMLKLRDKLNPLTSNYLKKHKEIFTNVKKIMYEDGNLKKYEPEINLHSDYKQFKKYHWDNDAFEIENRIITMIIYLNDVEKGGETTFKHINVDPIKPKKGNVLIFPSGPLFAHRGNNPISNTKHICVVWVRNTTFNKKWKNI